MLDQSKFHQAALKVLNLNSCYCPDGPPEILRCKLCKKWHKSVVDIEELHILDVRLNIQIIIIL